MKLRSAAAVSAMLFVLAACAEGSGAAFNTAFRASESVYFENIAELLATADVAVIATVEDVVAGPDSFPGTPDEVQRTTVVLQPQTVLRGDDGIGQLTVETLELAYVDPHMEWRIPGTQVVAFLTNSLEGRPIYIPTNHSQSIYVLKGEDLFATVQDPFSEAVADASLPDFLVTVEEAQARIAVGDVKPKERSD